MPQIRRHYTRPSTPQVHAVSLEARVLAAESAIRSAAELLKVGWGRAHNLRLQLVVVVVVGVVATVGPVRTC